MNLKKFLFGFLVFLFLITFKDSQQTTNATIKRGLQTRLYKLATISF